MAVATQFKGIIGVILIALLLTACASDVKDNTNGQNEGSSGQNTAADLNAANPSNEGTGDAAEQTGEKAIYPRSFRHVYGETALEQPPVRIYAPYLEDALLTLGVTPVLKWSVGELVQDYLEPQLKDVPKIDFAGGPDAETIIASEPDLIILYSSEMAAEGRYEQYSKIAPTFVFDNAAGNWEDTLQTLGDILDRKKEAADGAKQYADLVAEAKAKLGPVADGKTFAVVRMRQKELLLMDGVYFSGLTLYRDLGLTPHPMVKELSWEGHVSLSLEKLPELDADYIFYMIQGSDSQAAAEELMNSFAWQSLPAVKAGHAYQVQTGHWLATGAIANAKQINDVLNDIKD